MVKEKQVVSWIAILVVLVLAVYVLRSVLVPFIAGIAVAYFLDPLADRVEAQFKSRTLATVIILLIFFATVTLGAICLFPLLQTQVLALVERVPEVYRALSESVQPMLEQLRADLTPEQQEKVRDTVQGYAGDAVQWAAGLLSGLWSGGLAVVHVLSMLFITPLVAFFLLRDWDNIVARLDHLLPRSGADTIREQAWAIDRTIAGFVRGQGMACMVLATIYGTGLSLIGLDSGLLVGMMTGLLAFVPYVGMAIGLVTAMAIGLSQFDTLQPFLMIALVYGIGQTIDAAVLQPKLVGGSVGLHPVWILLALMAGGTLFGFTGVLLAVPTAASIGVLVRFAVSRYLDSPLYRGDQASS